MSEGSFNLLLRGFLRRRPWRSFTLEFINGTRVEVNHPEAVTRHDGFMNVASTTGTRCYFEYVSVVRFIDATGLA
jgi:hypothetical protein